MCFFKQKTAYEMLISDWSSDVFSSDLRDCPDSLDVEVDEHVPAKDEIQPLGSACRGGIGIRRQIQVAERDPAAVPAAEGEPVSLAAKIARGEIVLLASKRPFPINGGSRLRQGSARDVGGEDMRTLRQPLLLQIGRAHV